jgi:RluA family pseudouridine synthase
MTPPPVIFEDDVLIAFNKPGGIPVAPGGSREPCGSLMSSVHRERGPQICNVHRLDRDASGVLLCARTKGALDSLSGQFQAKTVESIVHALVVGSPAQDTFDVQLPLAEDKGRPGFMLVVKRGGRPAATSFRVLERFRGFAWLECRPATNRPHQVRVHLMASGLPVLNDDSYGSETRLLLSALKRGYKGRDAEQPLIRRLAIHASSLTVTHPVTRARLTIGAPLPDEIEIALKYLRRFGAIRKGGGSVVIGVS